MSSLSILFIGLLLGMKHATEADHLAAVATLATRQGTLGQAVKQGVAWGIGHTFTLMIFGGIVLALGKSIPPDMERMLELAVGAMLVALGIDVLRRLWQQRIHFHVHRHADGTRHVHAHSHAGEVRNRYAPHRAAMHRHAHAATLPVRALAIGMMHGMAGSAALILLSLEAVGSVPMGMLYIGLFGAGSILGMALLSVAIAIPLRYSAGYFTWLHNGLAGAVGAGTCLLGLYMVYEIGLVEGLLLR
ncbi:MAG: urease accessory protein [Betaproteobacteria bacterium]|nr:urease accessory protein [Betaproteobacteria bacterium]